MAHRLAGVVVVVIGGVLARPQCDDQVQEALPMRSMSSAAQKTTTVSGLVGSIARGIVVARVGVLLITAAVQFDPRRPAQSTALDERSRYSGRSVATGSARRGISAIRRLRNSRGPAAQALMIHRPATRAARER